MLNHRYYTWNIAVWYSFDFEVCSVEGGGRGDVKVGIEALRFTERPVRCDVPLFRLGGLAREYRAMSGGNELRAEPFSWT